MLYEWNEAKREANLIKHGLDFARAVEVYEATYKITLPSLRAAEMRFVDIAEVDGEVIALSLVYTLRGEAVRVISLRKANRKERRVYDESKDS